MGGLSESNTIIREFDSELKEKYDVWLKETEETLEEAIRLLSNRLEIDNSDLLSSVYYYIKSKKRRDNSKPYSSQFNPLLSPYKNLSIPFWSDFNCVLYEISRSTSTLSIPFWSDFNPYFFKRRILIA